MKLTLVKSEEQDEAKSDQAAHEPREGEPLADFINRNRPAGVPLVDGSPSLDADMVASLEWRPDGWIVTFSFGDDEGWCIAWSRADDSLAYTLDQDGRRETDAGDWTPEDL